jgi:two-component SAPR family response regulator
VKVMLVDDEPAMLLAMRRLLSKMEGVELVGSFQSAKEALHFVQQEKVELAFLDIKIAEDNGLELARNLRLINRTLDIVFTTSHSEFAMQAFDVYPLDYMVKPISRLRLAQTIAQAANRHSAFLDNGEESIFKPLMVRGLGCFEVSDNQGRTVKWISKKSMELFAYLLVNQGRGTTRTRILEDIFPEMPLKNAETYLHTAIYQIRKVLSPNGLKEMVLSVQDQYRVNVDLAEVDFIQFEQDIKALAEINPANAAAAIKLEKQYTGELFEDKSFEWVAMERERLAIMYDSLAKRLASWLAAEKRYREAALIARRLVSRNEFEEDSNVLLLRILGAMGDRQSLYSCYERYTQLLQQELGIHPSDEIREIYEQYQ